MFQLLDELSWHGLLHGYNVTVYNKNSAIAQADVGNLTVYTNDEMYDNQMYNVCVTAYNVIDENTRLPSEASCIERLPVQESE